MVLRDDCVFCQLNRDGKTHRFQQSMIRFFVPLNPVVPGHILFIPDIHLDDAVTDPATTGMLVHAASIWGNHNDENFNLIVNNGPEAGQTVFHLHIHYVPRFANDGLIMPWTAQQLRLEAEKANDDRSR